MPHARQAGRLAAAPATLLACLALAALLACLAPVASARAAFGDRTLRPGAHGHDVRVLQSWLTRLGFRTSVDGDFGAGTERSVRRYEGRNRLRRDGVVSPPQARRMRRQVEGGRRNASSGASVRFGERPLSRGDRGHDVRVLQSWLTRLGQETEVDGIFGAGTERSLEAWERASGLAADGELSTGEAATMRAQVERGDQPAAPQAGGVFPVRGRHRFGARRNGHAHQGQDVFAACGTPLVAARDGTVRFAGYHSAAGHYLVIRSAQSGEDMVYMHLRSAPVVRTGDAVQTGQRIGEVGESGNAEGCHLHFELWTKPGWYDGGHAYDPLPTLRAWDGGS